MTTVTETSQSMDDRSSKRLKGPDDVSLEDRRTYGSHSIQQRYPPAPYGSHAPPPGYAWSPHYNSQGAPGPPGSGHPPPGPPGAPGGPPPPHWTQVGGYGPQSRSPPPVDRGNWPPGGSASYSSSRTRKSVPSGNREDELEGPPGRYWSGGPHPGSSNPPPHHPSGSYRRGGGAGYWQQPGPMYPAGSGGWSKSPSRGSSRQDMMGAYPPGRGEEMGYMSTMTIQQASQTSFYDEDGAESSAGESGKDKGRGSYKCGRVSDVSLDGQLAFSGLHIHLMLDVSIN